MSRFDASNTGSGRFDSGSRYENGSSTTRYGDPTANSNSSSRFDNSSNGSSRFENGTVRGSWRDNFNKDNENNSTTKYGSWRDNSETPMNRYSSLNRDNNNDSSNKYTSKYSSNNNNNSNSGDHNGSKYSSNSSNGTTNRFGGGGKEDESAASGPGTSKYSFESILAKYKTNEESRQQQAANGTPSSSSNNNGTQQQSSRNYQNNTFPRAERASEAAAQTSISSTLSLNKPNVLELTPSVPSLTSPPVTTSGQNRFSTSGEARTATKDSGGQDRYSKLDSSLDSKDSLTPIVCRTSASSLTVTTPSYSRSNSNNSTETSGLYSRQVSNDNTPGRGSALGAPLINGHMFSHADNGNSLERRASKKYSHSGSGGWSDRKIEKANDVAEKIEQTLAKHQVHHHDPVTTGPGDWRQRDASVTRNGSGKPVLERESSVDRSEKSRILQDRGTSPGLETSQNASGGSRIGRASDIYSVRKTTYFQPNTREISSQTEAYYLKDRNSEAVENFDLYDHVKKSFQFTSYSDKTNGSTVNERMEKQKEKEEEVSKKFNIAMTPMTNMMPGYQKTSRDETSTENNYQNNVHSLSVPATTKAETESEWETDEDVIEAKPEEAKLEDALAKLDQLDLDSDDEKRYR